jgi:hypothetical protein
MDLRTCHLTGSVRRKVCGVNLLCGKTLHGFSGLEKDWFFYG